MTPIRTRALMATMMTLAMAAPAAAQDLTPFDSDADGTLDASELRAAFAARGVAAGLDVDGDDLLAPVELAEALHALWDTDENGTLSVGEWDDGVDQWFGEDPVNLAVEVWDRDGDGSVSETELALALEETELFATFDADADGLLGDEELADMTLGTAEDGLLLEEEDSLLVDMAELFFTSEDSGAERADDGIDAEAPEVGPLEDQPPLIERGEPFVQLPVPCDGTCEETAARFCEALGYEPPIDTLAVAGRLHVIRCADEA